MSAEENPKKEQLPSPQSPFIPDKYDHLVWLFVVLVLGSYFFSKLSPGESLKAIAYSDFLAQVEQDSVQQVEIQGRLLRGSNSSTTEQFDF